MPRSDCSVLHGVNPNKTKNKKNCDSTRPSLLLLFISSDASICCTIVFPPLRNSDRVAVYVSIDFPWNSQQDAQFHWMTSLVPIGTVFAIIWEMFCGEIYLNSVLLLLLVNFVSEFRLELLYILLIVSIRSSFTYLHDFQILVLLS